MDRSSRSAGEKRFAAWAPSSHHSCITRAIAKQFSPPPPWKKSLGTFLKLPVCTWLLIGLSLALPCGNFFSWHIYFSFYHFESITKERSMRNTLGWFRTTRRTMLGVFIAALAASLLFGQASAQQVAIERTGFDNIPDKFFYFKDSDVSMCANVAGERVSYRLYAKKKGDTMA